MHVEIATLNQCEQIAHIMNYANNRNADWSLPRINKYIRKESHDILVAIEDDTVGYAGMKALFDDQQVKDKLGDGLANLCQLTWLGVLPQHQNQGIGRMLVAHAERWTKDHGKNGFWLGCRERLVGFYEHLGFKLFGQYEAEGKTRYIMVKNLD